jgi:type VI protein secretion system component Hcp
VASILKRMVFVFMKYVLDAMDIDACSPLLLHACAMQEYFSTVIKECREFHAGLIRFYFIFVLPEHQIQF